MRADLGSLAASLKAAPLKDLATARAGQASLSAAGWTADLSRQYLDAESDAALLAHGAKAGLEGAAASLFNGDIVNPSENRPALHWALRAQAPLAGEAEKVRQSVLPALEFARRVQDGDIRTVGGAPYKAVLHIGIGGSDFGPRLIADAFADLADLPAASY